MIHSSSSLLCTLLAGVAAATAAPAQITFGAGKIAALPAGHVSGATVASVGDLDGDGTPDAIVAGGSELGAYLGPGRYSGYEPTHRRSARVDDLVVLHNNVAPGGSTLFTSANGHLVQWRVVETTDGESGEHRLVLDQVSTLSNAAHSVAAWSGAETFGYLAINEGGIAARLMARMQPDGAFFAEAFTLSAQVSDLCLADLNGDGGPELVLFGSNSMIVCAIDRTILYAVSGDFSNAVPQRHPGVGGAPESVVWYQNDPGSTQIGSYSLAGGLTLEAFAAGAIQGAAVGDFDHDLDQEFVVMTAGARPHVGTLLATGSIAFESQDSLGPYPVVSGLVAEDFDGDGDLDLMAAADHAGVPSMVIFECRHFNAQQRRANLDELNAEILEPSAPRSGASASAPVPDEGGTSWSLTIMPPDDLEQMDVNAVEVRVWRGADPATLADALEKMYVEVEYYAATQQLAEVGEWPVEGLSFPGDEQGDLFGEGMGPDGWVLPVEGPTDRIYYVEVRPLMDFGSDAEHAYPSTFYAVSIDDPFAGVDPMWTQFLAIHEPAGHLEPLPGGRVTPLVRTRKIKNVDPVICGISLPQ